MPVLCARAIGGDLGPVFSLGGGDVLFPFDESWIEEHFDRKESWVGETGPLEFVIYERN
ncbi:MAG: hypothetical protein VYC95_01230 [Verrucomicrobiota bacterium]|nr:hypothetical protein [Verrucomicrobiota bacterium]